MARTTPVNAGYTIINGTGTGSHGGRIDVWMEYKVISQDIPSNGTVLDVRFYTARVASASSNTKYDSGMNSTITVNGVAGTGVKNAAYDFSTTKVHDLGSWYGAIYHNADGSKSVSVSGSFTTRSSYISGGNISTTITLPTIPRASSVTTSGNEIGGELVVTITPAVSTFKHSLYLVFGTQTLTMASQTSDTVVRYTLPMELVNQFTNAEYGVGTVYCDTYNGSTMIGTTGKSVNLYAPASVIPTIEGVSVKDVGNTIPTGWGVYVQGKSKAEISIDGASGVYGSSIRSYSIEGGGFSGATNPLVTGWLSSGDITFTAYATDSRGRKSEAQTASIYVHPYANPKLTNIQILRCDASGGETDDGEYISVYFEEEHSSCGGKNTAHTVLCYKSVNSTSWASTADLVAGQANILSGFPTSASYDLELIVSDAFINIPYTDRLSAAERAININPSGKGLAIGKMSEKEAFEVEWDTFFKTRPKVGDDEIALTKDITGGGTSGDYMPKRPNAIEMQTSTGEGHGGVIDFHHNGSTEDYTSRIVEYTSGVLTLTPSINVPGNISIGGARIADFVTDQGASGNWRFRAWNSGMLEQWGYGTVTGKAATTAWGGIYTTPSNSPAIVPGNYMVGFTAAPMVQLTLESTNNGDCWAMTSVAGTATTAPQYRLARGTSSSSLGVKYSIYAVGRWK